MVEEANLDGLTASQTKKWPHGGMVGAPRAIPFFSGITGIPAS